MGEYETIEYKGHTITTGFEDDGSIFDPRDGDNLGTMNCSHGRYTFGDEQTSPDDMRVPCPTCSIFGDVGEVPVPVTFDSDDELDSSLLDGMGWTHCPTCDSAAEVADPVRWAVEVEGATVVLGLYLYDHSGITMSASTLYRDGERVNGGNPFTCRWDSGMVGIMYDTPKGLQTCFGKHERVEDRYVFTGEYLTSDGAKPDADRIEQGLHAEVKVYDAYLTNDIMWYRVEGDLCDEAVGGFFPDETGGHDYMVKEAKAEVDASIEREAKQSAMIERMMAL